MSRVRLDVMAILYERMLAKSFRFTRYILMDSSPQRGYNFLCVREDRVAIPVDQLLSPEMRANFDINSGFQTRLCPLSTLGVGNAGLVKKGLSVINIPLMESDSKPAFNTVRGEYRGGTADHGDGETFG